MCDKEYTAMMHVMIQPAKISETLQQFNVDSSQEKQKEISDFINEEIKLSFFEII
jgi:hypothetical protein